MAFRLLNAIPKLASLDLVRSLEFFGKLGFEVQQPTADYGLIWRDEVEIHFWLCNDPSIPRATACRIEVESIDELADLLERHGALSEHGRPALRPWGYRECHLYDPDGNLVTFAESAR
ncbi:VOC family protein [Chitinimonas lacunae]|uniref:VOC family protein n=1 Tax=Chitinimonas lacunae TaxID=1963018 RepID=A0ABV8MX96_9NEIS